jgi:cytochrome c6
MRSSRVFILFMIIALVFSTVAPVLAQDTAALYKAKCASCHGPDGKGETAVGKKIGVRDFNAAEVAKQSDDEFIKITKDGKGKMPGYAGKISDDDIKALVKYIRTLK